MIETAATSAKRVKFSLLIAAALLFFGSCAVKNYPANKPYVYEANVHVLGDMKREQRKGLETSLRQQLHDSIGVRRVSKLFFSQLKNPPVYDSINVSKSIQFMNGLMHSLGYYRDSIVSTDTLIRKAPDEQRVTIDFYVYANQRFNIDSISVALNDTVLNNPRQAAALDTLQLMTETALGQKDALVRKGEPFAKPIISAELDRLTESYRNRGFLRFSREDLLVLWDTVGVALLRPTVDPLEQAQLLRALQQRRANPKADVEFRLRPIGDSTHLTRYYVGNITVYPDLTLENSKLPLPKPRPFKDIAIVAYDTTLFLPKVLAENVYLRRGALYDQRVQQRQSNRFNALSAWRMASVDAVPRPGTDSVDS